MMLKMMMLINIFIALMQHYILHSPLFIYCLNIMLFI